MIPVKFDYAAPTNLKAAIKLLNKHFPEAEILAGGHSLLMAMAKGQTTPSLLIDLVNIPNLHQIKSGQEWELGAMATYDRVANVPAVKENFRVLAEAVGGIGDPQIRNWGRIGDIFAYQDLAWDIPTVALALEATFTVVGLQGQKVLNAQDFIDLWVKTQGKLREIVTSINFSSPSEAKTTGSAYESFKHPGSFYTLCGIATWIELSETQIITKCRIAAIGAIETPMRLTKVEEAIVGQKPNRQILSAIAPLAQENLQQIGKKLGFPADLYASSPYRIHLGGVLTKRSLGRAIEQAGLTF